jgi:hypothetical protein
MKNRVPVMITILVGVFMILKFFLSKVRSVTMVADEFEQWSLIAMAVAVILGMANITRVNWAAIRQGRQGWQYSVVLLVSMGITVFYGIYDKTKYGTLTGKTFFNFLFTYVYNPLGATVFALLAFFIASAAFRAFRAKNLEATLMLAAAILVMIGRVPLGAQISSLFPNIANWLMAYPNAAGQRGIIIGAAMGVMAVGLRIIFGIEKPYLRGD